MDNKLFLVWNRFVAYSVIILNILKTNMSILWKILLNKLLNYANTTQVFAQEYIIKIFSKKEFNLKIAWIVKIQVFFKGFNSNKSTYNYTLYV